MLPHNVPSPAHAPILSLLGSLGERIWPPLVEQPCLVDLSGQGRAEHPAPGPAAGGFLSIARTLLGTSCLEPTPCWRLPVYSQPPAGDFLSRARPLQGASCPEPVPTQAQPGEALVGESAGVLVRKIQRRPPRAWPAGRKARPLRSLSPSAAGGRGRPGNLRKCPAG